MLILKIGCCRVGIEKGGAVFYQYKNPEINGKLKIHKILEVEVYPGWIINALIDGSNIINFELNLWGKKNIITLETPNYSSSFNQASRLLKKYQGSLRKPLSEKSKETLGWNLGGKE